MHREVDKAGIPRRQRRAHPLDDSDPEWDEDLAGAWEDVTDDKDEATTPTRDDEGRRVEFSYQDKAASDRVRALVWKRDATVQDLTRQLARIKEVVDEAKVPTSYEHTETWANGEVKRCTLQLDLPYRVKRLVDPAFKPEVFVSWGR